ncbi:hypothetical protein LX97_01535 [Nonlabens dokdonensis]|uniref:Lipoprotein n=2 Tax=Nonlabens dokdonensis TaxID=328515 RepID=L7WEC0_NONDD|nr:hypothetical protein [Nonlabens dokdonensis]AGC77228.1 hypothetical protein DDD_2101 [Nonlabens dokdonensis DSW-6]PZX40764.1 hypothetical protein LX97_01535 [Nonlabens dokdonensis]
MKNYLLLFVALTLLSCGTSKSTVEKEVMFTGQEFDMDLFKGKWLTNGKKNKKEYSIFREDFQVENNKNQVFPYQLKKDSIFVYKNSKRYFGRLIKLNEKEVFILWGDQEAITYYRP